jgi:DNA-binding PadR family transcriptional regulator
MSSVDLVILGFIKKGPLSAYDMAKVVERTDMTKWLKIGLPTIYQNLRKLAEKGYLTVDSISNGNMPEKAVYSISPAGEAHWLELMNLYSSEPGNIHFDFNAFVINISLLDSTSALRMLENLSGHFRRQRKELERLISESGKLPFGGRAIMEQYRRLYDAMIAWAGDCLVELKPAASEQKP